MKSNWPEISDYLTLGPLGTAFFGRPYQAEGSETCYPRVLLIDEIDRSDIDMPNDLLHLFEEGEFEIPELGRLESGKYQQNEQSGKKGFRIKPADYDNPASFQYQTKLFIPADGWVRCPTAAFPLVIMTSNGEARISPRVPAPLPAIGHAVAGRRQAGAYRRQTLRPASPLSPENRRHQPTHQVVR